MQADTAEIREHAPAKVNLALRVLRRRVDGFHELDSLVAFVPEAADELRLAPAEAFSLRVTGPRADAIPTDDSNLALRAARALHRRRPDLFAPVRITLEKHLPAAAGIGGGSADAAAVMRAMCRLFRVSLSQRELHRVALALGADVPVCLRGRAARMRGVGERLEPLRLPPGVAVLLANPGVEVPTAEVFRRLGAARARAGAMRAAGLSPAPSASEPAAFIDFLCGLHNDLEQPAMTLAPAIDECIEVLSRLPGVRLARMSGSGATCLALFANRNEAERARRVLRRHRPRWWSAAGRLL